MCIPEDDEESFKGFFALLIVAAFSWVGAGLVLYFYYTR